MHEAYLDGVFFHKATALLGKQDINEAMISFYDFLCESFPLDGIVIHHFMPKPTELLSLYCLRKNRLDFVGRSMRLIHEHAMFLHAFSMGGGGYCIPNSQEAQVASYINADMRDYMNNVPRSNLVCCLKAGNAPLGLLRAMGTHVNCFDETHERRISMLTVPLSFALLKLLRLPESERFLKGRGYSYRRIKEATSEALPKLIGAEGGLKPVLEVVEKLAATDAPVLIMGETGTGKELIADAVHAGSLRAGKPFIKVNCGAIPDTLIDSTLFGHEKGSFTGAISSVPGKFEQANGGTLFLDELGELPLPAQVRLLRTLQNRVVERVGSTVSIPVNVRIICATNRDLTKMLQEGSFRADLFYRLNVFPIQIPPLRERRQDILALAHHFVDRVTARLNLPPISGIEPASAEALMRYSWPGNVRELENLVERAVTLNYDNKLKLDLYLPRESSALQEQSFSDEDMFLQGKRLVQRHMPHLYPDMAFTPEHPGGLGRPRHLDDAMREHILSALEYSRGKVHGRGGAGEILGINPDTLRKRMKKLGIA